MEFYPRNNRDIEQVINQLENTGFNSLLDKTYRHGKLTGIANEVPFLTGYLWLDIVLWFVSLIAFAFSISFLVK